MGLNCRIVMLIRLVWVCFHGGKLSNIGVTGSVIGYGVGGLVGIILPQ